jgi:hypothetical protein
VVYFFARKSMGDEQQIAAGTLKKIADFTIENFYKMKMSKKGGRI